ncbi:MAG: hypothetical protein K8R59_05175 [Thermoanaerobaculales bacterium]|nr:hypothetical protein [Thermoanaerobaculales bacterium]
MQAIEIIRVIRVHMLPFYLYWEGGNRVLIPGLLGRLSASQRRPSSAVAMEKIEASATTLLKRAAAYLVAGRTWVQRPPREFSSAHPSQTLRSLPPPTPAGCQVSAL